MAKIISNWVNQKKQWLMQLDEEGTLFVRNINVESGDIRGVASITAGRGLLGGTIVQSGTIDVDFGPDFNQVARGNHFHNAVSIPILDSGNYYSATNMEDALQEVGSALNLETTFGEFTVVRRRIHSLSNTNLVDRNNFMNTVYSAPYIFNDDSVGESGTFSLLVLGETRKYEYSTTNFLIRASSTLIPAEMPGLNLTTWGKSSRLTFRREFVSAYSRPRLTSSGTIATHVSPIAISIGYIYPDGEGDNWDVRLVYLNSSTPSDLDVNARPYDFPTFSAMSNPISPGSWDPRILIVHESTEDDFSYWDDTLGYVNNDIKAAAKLVYVEDQDTNTLKGYSKIARWSKLPGTEFTHPEENYGDNRRQIPWIRQEYEAVFPETIRSAAIDVANNDIYVVAQHTLYKVKASTPESMTQKYMDYYQDNPPTSNVDFCYPFQLHDFGNQIPEIEIIETQVPVIIYENNEDLVDFQHIYLDDNFIYLSSDESIIKLNKSTLIEVSRNEHPIPTDAWGWVNSKLHIIDGMVYNDYFLQVGTDSWGSWNTKNSWLRFYNKDTLILEKEFTGYEFSKLAINNAGELVFYDMNTDGTSLDWGVGDSTIEVIDVCIFKKTTPLLTALNDTSNILDTTTIAIPQGETWLIRGGGYGTFTVLHDYLRYINDYFIELRRDNSSNKLNGNSSLAILAEAQPNWPRSSGTIGYLNGWLIGYSWVISDSVASYRFIRDSYTGSQEGLFTFGGLAANMRYYLYYTYQITALTQPTSGIGAHFRAGFTSGLDVNTVGSGYVSKFIQPDGWLSEKVGTFGWYPEVNYLDFTFKRGTAGRITQVILIPIDGNRFGATDEKIIENLDNYINRNIIPKWPPGSERYTTTPAVFKMPSYEELIFKTTDAELDIIDIKEDIIEISRNVAAIIPDKHYVHNQQTSQTTWVINHNLNKTPSILVMDSFNNEIIGDIVIIDSNTVTITFTVPTFGKAYLN